MAALTTTKRNALPDSDFALPGRRYPLENESHARDALSRASANASTEEQAQIKRKVHAKFPGIAIDGQITHGKQ